MDRVADLGDRAADAEDQIEHAQQRQRRFKILSQDQTLEDAADLRHDTVRLVPAGIA